MGSPKRVRVIDFHTYGDSKAGENLADMLNTIYPHLHRRVGCYYHKFTGILTSLVSSWPQFRSGGLLELMALYRAKKFDVVECSLLPEEVKTHLLNVMSSAYAEKLKVAKKMLGPK